jgi:hypothetical protein
MNSHTNEAPLKYTQEQTATPPHPVARAPHAGHLRSLIPPILVFLAGFCLYSLTAAPATLFGDPSEYQFVPAILGISHPPGYAFYTLLAGGWQRLVPIGSIPFRTNLLASAAGAWAVTAVYLIVVDLAAGRKGTRQPVAHRLLPPLFAALNLALAPDLWQHAIHSNAHIVSAALAATHLWLLVRWWRTGRDGWLFGFSLTLGWAATHHPITLMGVPAYALFILAVRPRILIRWRTLAGMIGAALLGLLPLLYYPLRSPTAPFGPNDMNTWQGFVRHTTAQGLRGNLFHFGMADQADRALVFWSLLSLQFTLPVIFLILVGLFGLIRRAPRPALLVGAFLAGHLAFTLNTVQDVMAYLLLPFTALSILSGMGALALMEGLAEKRRAGSVRWRVWSQIDRLSPSAVYALLFLLLLPWPLVRGAQNLSRGISLRDFTAAETWVEQVYWRFDDQGEGAVLLSDWEHLPPLWVHHYAYGREIDPADLQPVYVSPANPWVESVWTYIETGPIYLPDYRPDLRAAGFRLVPEDGFLRVAVPPVTGTHPSAPLDVWAGDRVHLLGYDLPTTTVHAGEPVHLNLYQSVTEPLESIWMPYAQLGPVEARWTTDSRLLTPQWLPREVVVEQYTLPTPFTLPPGVYPLWLGYADLTGGQPELTLSTGERTIELARITVLPHPNPPPQPVLEGAIANLDNQVGLMDVRARAGRRVRRDLWDEPLPVQAGQPLHLTLTWRALVSPRESFTVFVHLLDGRGQYVLGHDYTPLGGSFPSYLWFPKWLPGQTFLDPYRIVLPPDLPPGDYWVEVGMYGMTSLRRLPVVDLSGSLAGDRVILGPIRVTTP